MESSTLGWALLDLLVLAGAALQGVIARAALERVVAGLALELVVAPLAEEGIVALASTKHVLAAPAADHVVPGEAGECVVSAEADDHVLTRRAAADVVALGADDGRREALTGRRGCNGTLTRGWSDAWRGARRGLWRGSRSAGGDIRVLGLVTKTVVVAVGLEHGADVQTLVCKGSEGPRLPGGQIPIVEVVRLPRNGDAAPGETGGDVDAEDIAGLHRNVRLKCVQDARGQRARPITPDGHVVRRLGDLSKDLHCQH